MFILFESIRVEDGVLLNISSHNERIIRTMYNIYGVRVNPDLENTIVIPDYAARGIFMCRYLYDDNGSEAEFIPYSPVRVRSLKLIFSDEICYPNKYTARDRLNKLYGMREDCDDILIIKYGKVTDSSNANVILSDSSGNLFTPASCLLQGTRRALLLGEGIIMEADISVRDINRYNEIKLINAMTGLDDTESIPVRNLIKD